MKMKITHGNYQCCSTRDSDLSRTRDHILMVLVLSWTRVHLDSELTRTRTFFLGLGIIPESTRVQIKIFFMIINVC